MQSRANPDEQSISATKDPVRVSDKSVPKLEISVIDSDSEELRSDKSFGSLYDQAAKYIRSNTWVYLFAGACYSIVMTFLYLIAGNLELLPIRILFLFITFIWPAVLVISIFNVVDKIFRFRVFLLYFLVFFLVSILASLLSSDTPVSQMFLSWIIFNLPATILILAFLNRKIRAVGPLVLTFMFLATTGAVIAVSILAYDENLLEVVAEIGYSFGLDAYAVLIAVILVGFGILALVGWYVLKFLGRLYIDKKISDKSINADSLMLLYSVAQSISLAFEGAIWIFSGLLGFLVYKIATSVGFNMTSKKTLEKVHKLLLLRVFSLGKRSEALFDQIGSCWRQVGVINMIAGPDLATTTVEPHEFLSFVGGRLSRGFVDSKETFNSRMSEVDLVPDPDGRFRVNEFFCFDDTWKMVLNGLVSESDVVLMDLRGFKKDKNDGCKHEIQELINLKAAKEILFIIDHTTEAEYLKQIIHEYWSDMRPESPNMLIPDADMKLYKYENKRQDMEKIFSLLGAS